MAATQRERSSWPVVSTTDWAGWLPAEGGREGGRRGGMNARSTGSHPLKASKELSE